MLVLRVKVYGETASFRRPHDLNYQRTYPLPPPTTLLGFAGAALGIADRELWAPDSPARRLQVAVLSEARPGLAQDTWTLLKFKQKRISGRSPYAREVLFGARFTLLFGGEESMLRQLEGALRDPVFPLSLGREDELALVEEVSLQAVGPGAPIFRGTIVPGDVTRLPSRLNLTPGTRIGLPMVVDRLPLAFSVDKAGVRHPGAMVPLTFLPADLEIEIPGLDGAMAVEGRSFVWMNSSPSHSHGSP